MHQLTFCTSITWTQPGMHGSLAPQPQAYVTKCSGARTFQCIFSFPETKWRQMTGETNDHLPAFSAFCKFQRLKVKRVMTYADLFATLFASPISAQLEHRRHTPDASSADAAVRGAVKERERWAKSLTLSAYVQSLMCVCQSFLGLSTKVCQGTVEVHTTQGCRGLSRPVEACRGSVECRGLTP